MSAVGNLFSDRNGIGKIAQTQDCEEYDLLKFSKRRRGKHNAYIVGYYKTCSQVLVKALIGKVGVSTGVSDKRTAKC